MGDMKHGWYALGRYHACQRKCFGFARDVVEWTAELPHRPLADIAVQVPLAGPVPSWTGAFKSLIVQFSNVEALTIIDNDKKRRVDKYHRHHHMIGTQRQRQPQQRRDKDKGNKKHNDNGRYTRVYRQPPPAQSSTYHQNPTQPVQPSKYEHNHGQWHGIHKPHHLHLPVDLLVCWYFSCTPGAGHKTAPAGVPSCTWWRWADAFAKNCPDSWCTYCWSYSLCYDILSVSKLVWNFHWDSHIIQQGCPEIGWNRYSWSMLLRDPGWDCSFWLQVKEPATPTLEQGRSMDVEPMDISQKCRCITLVYIPYSSYFWKTEPTYIEDESKV